MPITETVLTDIKDEYLELVSDTHDQATCRQLEADLDAFIAFTAGHDSLS
jgi:hypothetical protein